MKREYVYTVVFIFVLSAVFTAFLAGANAFFLPAILENQELARKKSILYTFGIKGSSSAEEISQTFDRMIKQEKQSGTDIYVNRDPNGKVLGYAVPFSGSGLWGTIHGYLALSPDKKTILGVDFTSHSETPGLGGRIDEEWFKAQFRGISLEAGNKLSYKSENNGQLDAVTGATITSKSVLQILNQLVESRINALEVAK